MQNKSKQSNITKEWDFKDNNYAFLIVKNALLASQNAFLHTYLEGYHYCKTGNFNSKKNVKNQI